MIVKPIVIGALGTVTKGFVQGLDDLEIRGRVETIHVTVYQDRSEYWEESWRLEETYSHSDSSEKPSADAGVKNSKKCNIIIALSNYSNNLQLYGINYSYRILIIKKSSIWLIDRTLKCTTIPGTIGPGSNNNEGVQHTLQICRNGTSPSDTVSCNIYNTWIVLWV